MAGETYSNNGDVSGNHGAVDYWIVKLDSVGGATWKKTFGGSNDDVASSAFQTSDGGYVVEGYTNSTNGNVTGNHGQFDYWILKLDASGNSVWKKCFGGGDIDLGSALSVSANDGITVAGYAYSTNGQVTGNHGGYDFWVVRIGTSGNLVWEKAMGGTNDEIASCIYPTSDGGYILAGSSTSNDGDVSSNQGFEDFWVVKLTEDLATGVSAAPSSTFSVYPNPTQSQLIIDLAKSFDEISVQVFDLEGKEIQIPAFFSGSQCELNTSGLANGFYTLRIFDNSTGQTKTGKFIKSE